MRSDIITLAVMGTAFRNEDFVAVLYLVQSRGPCTAVPRSPL